MCTKATAGGPNIAPCPPPRLYTGPSCSGSASAVSPGPRGVHVPCARTRVPPQGGVKHCSEPTRNNASVGFKRWKPQSQGGLEWLCYRLQTRTQHARCRVKAPGGGGSTRGTRVWGGVPSFVGGRRQLKRWECGDMQRLCWWTRSDPRTSRKQKEEQQMRLPLVHDGAGARPRHGVRSPYGTPVCFKSASEQNVYSFLFIYFFIKKSALKILKLNLYIYIVFQNKKYM